MDIMEIYSISEQFMEIVNPSSEAKLLKAGAVAGLKPGCRVIDFGCGLGTTLVLWAEKYGISGIGIDIRARACERAMAKVREHHLTERLSIIHGKGQEYTFEPQAFHVAAAIGTTFIWDDFRGTIRAMKKALTPDGKLIVGEVYWKTDSIPADYHPDWKFSTERELLQASREEGFDIEFVIPSSLEEWDNYETGNWIGLLNWIEANPGHPDRPQVIEHLRKSQDEYFGYIRKYLGWALFILNPLKY